MTRLRVAEGDLVELRSRRGRLVLPARASTSVAPTQAFVAMHWGDEFLQGGVNALTNPATCPTSKQPELKHAAVAITRVDLPWRVLALGWFDDEAAALQARRALRAAMAGFAQASCVAFGRDRVGLLFRAAAAGPADGAVVEAIAQALALKGPQTLQYVDARRGQRRSLRLAERQGTRQLQAALLAGDTRAESWLVPLLQQEQPVPAGSPLLAPGALQPGQAAQPRDKQVCSCFDVRLSRIEAVLQQSEGTAAARLAGLQAALKCGTQCGSCVPELQRLVQQHAPAQAMAPTAAA
jgi:assimilatory nitrate reductase catalytic subunit